MIVCPERRYRRKRRRRIEAIVDELGRIIYYNHYEYGNYEGDYKLSGIDYNAAVKIAEKFLVKVCPEFALSLKPLHENYIERNYNNYWFVLLDMKMTFRL